MSEATLGNGCFWCTEAVFKQLKGVQRVAPGYSGGHVENPTYKQVCTGTTGHAEVVRISYDSTVISFAQLLEVYFKTHDPTTLNRQGNDVGTQYRSVIFTHGQEQFEQATKIKGQLQMSGAYASPIVTQIEPISNYFEAEDYHHNYFAQHGDQPYCAMVVKPKVEKFQKVFAGWLK